MMASRSFTFPAQPGGRSTLDISVAALAGFSVAFLAFAAPSDALAELIGLTGLSSILPAAEPPLGMTARIAIGAVGAVAMFTAAFMLLRWLDRFASSSGVRVFERTAIVETPRQRKRDAHPDAPPRPPICAARDLGEPFAEPHKAAPHPEPAPPASVQPEAAPAPAPKAASDPTSITDLMARLERGLARRAGTPAPRAAAAPPQVFPEAADDRLQSAIDGLQRLAARRD